MSDFIEPTRPSLSTTLGWAFFLGVSWTWCIGMFLPVLLVRDFGVVGWAIFAFPNVIGAAAMGWVITSTKQSVEMVERNRLAAEIFSIVTIAFQFFFVLWMVTNAWGQLGRSAFAAVYLLILLLGRIRATADRWLSVIAWLGSIVLLFLFFQHAAEMPIGESVDANISTADLVGLTLVCLFGFGLCPYLDLTFHRARQALNPLASKAAFTIGFVLIFGLMIVGSLLYSGVIGRWAFASATMTKSALQLIAAHWVLQMAYTCAVHTHELVAAPSKSIRWIAAGIVVIAALYFVYWPISMAHGELVYRLFMSFYGLLAPAYALFWIWPNRMNDRSRWIGLAVSILLATPMYWLGFISRRYEWLIPGVAVIVIVYAISRWRMSSRTR